MAKGISIEDLISVPRIQPEPMRAPVGALYDMRFTYGRKELDDMEKFYHGLETNDENVIMEVLNG